MKRTYVDAGVLIYAARNVGILGQKALAIIADDDREFVCSDYIRFEVVPKATYERRDTEVQFYERFFASVITWLHFDVEHLQMGFIEACTSGLKAMDAIHVVAAVSAKCDELVTSEKPTKPIHRTKLIPVLSIDTE